MNIANLIREQKGELFFEVEGNEITVSPSRDLYNSLRKKYDKLALNFKKSMSNSYDNMGSINILIMEYDSEFKKCIMPIITEMKKDLMSLECYDMDEDYLWDYLDEHGYFEEFQGPYCEVIERYEGITGELQSKKDYRQARKDNRPRWTSVTYGNQLDANLNRLEDGMNNAIEGLAHGAVNAVGNFIDKQKTESALRQIYNSSAVKKSFADGSYLSAFGLHFALIELLCVKELNPIDLDEIPGTEEIDKSRRMINNVVDVDKDKQDQIVCEAIDLYPYDEDGYKYWLKKYGDPNNEIQDLADYFGVDVTSVKDKMALEFVKGIQGKNENDAKEARERLLAYFDQIGLKKTGHNESLIYIDGLLKEFDKKYRTVDGYVCPTRKGADQSRQELKQITDFMQCIFEPDYDSLLDYEEELLAKKKEFEEKFHSEYAKHKLKTIDEYLKLFDERFRSVGFKTLDRKEAGKQRLLKLTKKHSYATPDDIKAATGYVESLLPKVGLDRTEAKESFDYVEKKKDEAAYFYIKKNKDIITEELAQKAKEDYIEFCKQIDLEYSSELQGAKYIDGILNKFDSDGRTVEGFVCSSLEAKEESLKELDDMKKFMENVYPPNSNSLMDYEMNLKGKRNEFDEVFSSELKKKYLDQMDKYLSDFDSIFCTVGFKKVDRVTAGKDKLLKYTKQFTMTNMEEINRAIQLVNERLYLYGIDREEAQDSYDYIDSKKDDVALSIIMQNGNVTTEEYAKQTKEYLISVCEQIGLPYSESLKSAVYINDIINKYDIMYRTVDGYVCSTREAADFARVEYQNIAYFMTQVMPPNNESLLGYERYVISKKEEFINSFNSELKNKYVSIMDKYLADFDKKFCSMGLLKTGTRKEAGIYKATQFAKKRNLTNDDDYNRAYSELMNLLPEFGITVDEARPAFEVYDVARANQYKKSLFGGFLKKH